ncbi:ATP-binding domain-containing protein, partial [Acinetobacter oleivorans]|uniref:3'-5' exonuclease n=1 Tax=Acinetobacter oleivorans TaxID=1148157 RepID=UPI0015811C0E
ISNKHLLKVCNSIEINEIDGLEYLSKFFAELFEKLGINWEIITTLKRHYDSFFSSSVQRIESLIAEGLIGIETLENFKKVFKQRGGITVSTIHGVKGEEYDVVIGFGLLDGFVPHFSDQNGEINSKKMLYVLASRARKNLHLISERMRNPHSYHAPNGKPPTPHLESYLY